MINFLPSLFRAQTRSRRKPCLGSNNIWRSIMHPLFLLAIATFLLVVGFLVWNILSVRRHRFQRDVTGPGGSSDPLSGKTEGMRHPDEMRADLDEASARR
jgi:hypothetical protein